ncbi:hypothetical protein AAVH_10106 [Aphelenchoides avenae]|nr:hypothetical protein AAVH_10106 [Aphelenchus avenae]
MKLRYCANFPDIYTVTKQLGDLGQARLEIMDSFNALYYYGTQFEPSYVIIVSVEGPRIQELQRNDPRNVASAMSMFRR